VLVLSAVRKSVECDGMQGYSIPVVSNGTATVNGTVVSIDNVRLDSFIGSGANGFVFAGEDELLKRRVAVKIWPPRLDRARGDENRRAQALAEAQKLARLNSNQIVSIYSAGQLNNGWIYIIMEHVEGVPLKSVRASLDDDFGMRSIFWSNVFRGLQDAQRIGIYHGDLHDGNVLVRAFHATLIDFGTSALAGKSHSLKRHASMVYQFAQRLLPELKYYVTPPDIPNLIPPQYVIYAMDHWVETARELRKLDANLSSISEQDLTLQLTSLADGWLPVIDLSEPVSRWLASRDVSPAVTQAYSSAAKSAVESWWRNRETPNAVASHLRPSTSS
jgi:serine/threonine protein kinase